MEEDWDNLIILDACRYDCFKEIANASADYRISRGSSTPDFIKENFVGRKFNDTVCVTANANVDRLAKRSFYHIVPVWKDGWDDRLNTVHPQTMLKYAIKAEREYPNKRLIIWFVQPHLPSIKYPELTQGLQHHNPWVEADRGNLEIDRVWKGYKSNLEIVTRYAFELAENLKGKTVITSDHGEAFRRLIFPPVRIVRHPTGIYIRELIKVPWHIVENKERKEIRKGEDETGKVKDKIRELKSLGKL